MGRRTLAVFEISLFAAALAIAVAMTRASDWRPIGLVVGLAVLTILSDLLAIRTKSMRLSGSFIAVVLAMALLGPLPAVLLQLLVMTVDSVRRPLPLMDRLANLSSMSVYPVLGALMVRWIGLPGLSDVEYALAVLAVFFVSNAANFALVALHDRVLDGASFVGYVRGMFLPMLPAQALAAVLTAAIAVTYRHAGALPLAAMGIVLFLFQVLTRELLLSQQRAEDLQARSTQLASLQVGVLAALVQTLSLRDRMTARHSAAVARYARAIAHEIGCSAADQELVHTAGLLHDIGKFAFPDRILLANRKLDEEDWKIVRTHPYQGARLVRRIDGYGPVADIILAHHERIDGRGYPRGLTDEQIPIFSKMISIADTYDVMTARDSYRTPVSQAEAIAELRRVSGAQLDGQLVEAFIRVLERSGLGFQHTTDADFERELGFDERVQGYAFPQAA
jgi:putative nucleotidyltransferase with HDIG domain